MTVPVAGKHDRNEGKGDGDGLLEELRRVSE